MGIAKIKPTQPQLGLAGAWAELGKKTERYGMTGIIEPLSKLKKLGPINYMDYYTWS